MTNYARIVNGVAVDVSTNPAAQFHADVAAQFVEVPDDVQPGWIEGQNGTWSAPPPPPAPPPAPYAALTPMQFYLAFTPAERIAIKKSTDPVVQEFWATYELAVQLGNVVDPNLASVVEGLEYLTVPTTATPPGPGILASTARVAQIQAGVPQ